MWLSSRHAALSSTSDKMAPSHSARSAATRGSQSARQWADIRQAARIARSEGVTVVLPNGFKVFGDKPAAGRRQQREAPVQDAGDAAPMDIEGAAAERRKKREERTARRWAEHIPRRCVERWRAMHGKLVCKCSRRARRTEG